MGKEKQKDSSKPSDFSEEHIRGSYKKDIRKIVDTHKPPPPQEKEPKKPEDSNE